MSILRVDQLQTTDGAVTVNVDDLVTTPGGNLFVDSLADVDTMSFSVGNTITSSKSGGVYSFQSSAPRNSRIPLIPCANGFLIPKKIDDGSQFVSCNKVQTLTNYQESGTLKAQGIEYDNQNSRAFITSYRTSGANQLTVIREYALNSNGTIGALISSCENLPFGHSEYVMFENAPDGNTYIWGHQGPTFAANAIIRLRWTGATTGSNAPTVSIPVTGFGSEKPFISWYGFEDSMMITFPSNHVSYICTLDSLIAGNLTPYKIIPLSQYNDILYPRIGQMIKHHGNHFVSLSGYFMDAPLGTRVPSTYETNALAGSIPENGQGFNLNLVDTSVTSLNEIENMAFKWDLSSEKYNSFAFSVAGDFNFYLYALTDRANQVTEDKFIKPWNVVPNDTSLSVWGSNRGLLKTPYATSASTIAVGGYNAGNSGSVTNTYDESNWVMSQLQGNASRQECGEYFYKALRKSVYGPQDNVRAMQWGLFDDRGSTGNLGTSLFSVSPNGVAIGSAFSDAQYASESLKYALYVTPLTGVGGLKIGSSSSSGKPSITLTGNRRLSTNDGSTLEVGSFVESTNTWTNYVSFTSVEAAFANYIRPQVDNSFSLGSAPFRWSVVYAGTGSINTSDENSKDSIEDVAEKALDAWAKVNYKQYKFKEALEGKGEQARTHIGVIAQEIKAAFESVGLDPFEYGILCYDSWEDEFVIEGEVSDEEGNILTPGKEVLIKSAGGIYGVRYEEALCLECALMRRRMEALELALSSKE